MHESPVTFDCAGQRLYGLVHHSHPGGRTGVLIVTGGPQYRVGSHRQFVLLARRLAGAGYPVMRFDYRGMGDSEGQLVAFDQAEEDIRASIDRFFSVIPDLDRVVLWGLCDAASAALIYAATDSRVAGVVILNPWVRTETGEARTILRHYYLKRLFSKDFWRSLKDFRPVPAARSLFKNIVLGLKSAHDDTGSQKDFVARMAKGLDQFDHPVLLIISGEDLTAAEFLDLATSSAQWRDLVSRSSLTRKDLADADHTFSKSRWRSQVEDWTVSWLARHFPVTVDPGQSKSIIDDFEARSAVQ